MRLPQKGIARLTVPVLPLFIVACGLAPSPSPTATPIVLPVLFPTATISASQYFESAEELFAQGQFELAANLYAYAISQDPYLIRAYTRLGQSYDNLGDVNSAIANYSLAIQVAPYIAVNYYYRGNVYYRLGAREQAIADFERFLEIEPDSILSEQVENLLLEIEQGQP
ncbi:MAG: tetratricopeptide repeat protein [Anaerolineae bacterium]|nr:MAG: tetratricopeptide repeat protein [Anaerolineae bacterium]